MSDEIQTDEQLLDLWQRHGDQNAATAIYSGRRKALLGYATSRLRQMGEADAERYAQECVQETFLRLFEEKKPLPCVKAWLFCVLAHLLTNHLRSRMRLGSFTSKGTQEDAIADRTRMPEEKAQQQELLELVRAAVIALPERLRVPIELKYFQGQTYEQIRRVLGITQQALAGRLHRGRMALGKSIEKQDGRLSIP